MDEVCRVMDGSVNEGQMVWEMVTIRTPRVHLDRWWGEGGRGKGGAGGWEGGGKGWWGEVR